jgi:membrane protease YdiL (CAAX protease family)
MLLFWHIARKDAWKFELSTVFGMVIESAVLGLPVLLLAFVVNNYFPLIGLQGYSGPVLTRPLLDHLIMDIGAGVYEEFLFRLVLFTALSLLLKDIFRMPERWVVPVIVAISAVSFSLYHYLSPTEHFIFRIFAFRALAGLYFGVIFMLRGFGITAGAHCAYDIIVTIC